MKLLTSFINKSSVAVIIFCLICFLAGAQNENENIPLHNYLQQNFDTTIILDVHSHDGVSPEYYIISFTGNLINTFTYKWPVTDDIFELQNLPADISKKYVAQLLAFLKTKPDTNVYFLPYKAYRFKNKTITKFIGSTVVFNASDPLKNSVDSLELWNITGDEKEGRGCKEAIRYTGIQPHDNYLIWIITPNSIKKLYFYEPAYF